MTILVDNDIVHKTAKLELFDEMLSAYGADRSSAYVLSTAKFKFGTASPIHKRAKAEAKYGRECLSRIGSILESVREVDWVDKDDRFLAEFSQVSGIDVGEAALFAALLGRPDAILMTGDKTSLRALATTPSLVPLASQLRGRIVCFEQILQACIGVCGFDSILVKVASAPNCDGVIPNVFGSRFDAIESDVIVGLNGYIREIRVLSIDLLVIAPE